LAWIRERLFPNVGSSLMTISIVLLLIWIVPPLIDFLIVKATWTGADREACLPTSERPEVAACWADIGGRFAYLIYGSAPVAGRCARTVCSSVGTAGSAWRLWREAPGTDMRPNNCCGLPPGAACSSHRRSERAGRRSVNAAAGGGAPGSSFLATLSSAIS